MHKRNPRRMEEISFERRQCFASYFFMPWRTVNRIAHNRAAQRRKMHADLVCSTGVQTRFDEGKAAEPQSHSPVCTRLAAFPASRRHSRAPAKIACNRTFDSPRLAFQLPVKQRHISFLDAPVAKVFHKFQVG